MKDKTFFHYRNAFKSDHLASADIEEIQENNEGIAILTISKIEYFENRKVAGRTKDKGLVAFFKDADTKPMIINSHNSKIIARFIGSSNVNEWDNLNLTIELYVDASVKMKGQVVGGIRVRNKQPKTEENTKTVISPKRFDNALKSIKEGKYSKERLMSDFILNPDQIEQLNGV